MIEKTDVDGKMEIKKVMVRYHIMTLYYAVISLIDLQAHQEL